MRSSSSNGAKPGFFGYLKGLFRKDDASAQAGYDTENTAVITEAVPLVPPPVEIGLAPKATAPVASVAPKAVPAANSNVDKLGAGFTQGISLPLQAIINNFPPELRERVRVPDVGDATVSVSIDKILAQLPQGQVRIPFGDIRKTAPEVFTSGLDFDRISVALPLNEILSRVNPALLVRRPAARQVDIPDEIASPFEGRGQGLSLSVGNAKPVQPAAPKKAAAPAPQVPVRGSISAVPRPAAPAAGLDDIPAPFAFGPATAKPAPVAPKVTAAPVPPPAPVATPQPAAPFNTPTPPPVRTVPQAPTAATIPFPAAAVPQRAQPQFAQSTFAHPAPAPAPVAPIAMPKPAAPASTAVITTALGSLMEAWPESVRLEILQTNLNESSVAMPVEPVENALKRGRVAFSWKTIRSWITPATPVAVSAHDGVELELPLKVIAPLFLARKHAASAPVNKVAVDEAIPNLFFGFPQSEPPAPPAPAPASLPVTAPSVPFSAAPLTSASSVAAASSAAAAAAAATTPVPPRAKPVDTNYYLWEDASETKLMHIEALKQKGSSGTEFVKRYASPNEIVSRAAALDGVAGALIALPDGLMVASRIPTDLNGDTLAAFLPQIFAKIGACTKELRMGELNNVSFTVGNVPWKIFRVNAIFFAAFGHAAQPMPTAQLAGLAGELDRKSNK